MPRIILFSLLFAVFSVSANDRSQQDSLEQLLKIEIAAYQLSSAFSAYVLFTGSERFSQKLERVINKTNPVLSDAQQGFPDIADKLQESLNFIQAKKELVYSPDDHRLIIGLATFQNPLYEQISDKKQAILANTSMAIALPPQLAESLDTQLSFERVLAQYIALSASSAGFVVSDVSIEDNVEAFSSRILQISNKGGAYKRLQVKWRFIKSNMLKNPGETSPFITMRTAVDIRALLHTIYHKERVSGSDF
jgi:hypothetical protein